MSSSAVETIDLSKHYGTTIGLEGLDLTVERGEVLGFLGPNGAGKTTTIRLLLDLIRPTRGHATVLGRPIGDVSVRSRIGYLPGELELDERLTGSQMLTFLDRLRPAGASSRERRNELCERLRLTDADLKRLIRNDSRGTKQKIGLVAALQHDPELLILDEPTSGLDPLVREEVFDLMSEARDEGRTVFHSSHVLSEVDKTCRRVAVLREGRLVALEDVAALRATLTRRMIVRFRAPVRAETFVSDSVRVVELGSTGQGTTEQGTTGQGRAGREGTEQEGTQLELEVTGDVNPLIAELARHDIDYLEFPEPQLDSAFRHLYAGDDT